MLIMSVRSADNRDIFQFVVNIHIYGLSLLSQWFLDEEITVLNALFLLGLLLTATWSTTKG